MFACSVVGAVTPIVGAAWRALRDGWIPIWDNAYPALRALDVLTTDPPLLGTRSRAGDFAGGMTTNHPGPFEFEVLAPWVRLFGPSDGTVLGMAFLNVVCIIAIAWLVRRRAGHLGASLAMAALALLAWSMGSEMLFDPWPPHAALLPFALFLVAAWSSAEQDPVALPIMTLAGSLALQVHLGYVLLVPGVTVAAVALMLWRRHRSGPGRHVGRWSLVALVTGLLSWVPPLYEELVGRPGNLTLLARSLGADGQASVPLDVAVSLVGGTLALPPWWLLPSFESPAVDALGHGQWWVTASVALLALCASVVVLARRAARRADSAVMSGLVLLLVAILLALLTVDQAPLGVGFEPNYSRFVWVVGAFSAMVVGAALVEELRDRPLPVRTRRALAAAPAATAVVAGLLAMPFADRAHTSPRRDVEVTRQLASQVIPALEGRGPVLIELSPAFSHASWIGPGLMVELEEAGVRFVVASAELRRQLGRRRMDIWSARHRLLISGRRQTSPGADARLLAWSDGITDAERLELEEVEDQLRDAFASAGGFPLDPKWPEDPPSEAAERTWIDVRELTSGRTPDELVRSGRLASMVTGWTDVFGDLDGLIPPDWPAADELERWATLRHQRDSSSVWIYLQPRWPRYVSATRTDPADQTSISYTSSSPWPTVPVSLRTSSPRTLTTSSYSPPSQVSTW